MKIISAHKDYYDNMRCFANPNYCSDDFTYIRRTSKPIELEEYFSFSIVYNDIGFKYSMSYEMVGFCGLWYPVYKVTIPPTSLIGASTYEYFYDLELALNRTIDHRYIAKCVKSQSFAPHSIPDTCRATHPAKVIRKIHAYFDRYHKEKVSKLISRLVKRNLFEKYNSPALHIVPGNLHRTVNLTVNPSLKDLAFYKLVEGNLAYQEIEIFLGNELLPKDNPDQITDNNIIITNHGFDLKTSFRSINSKASKKAKRKANKAKKQKKGK